MKLSDFAMIRHCRREAMQLVGLGGRTMEDEKSLFDKLRDRLNEIEHDVSRAQYLVVSGKHPAPFVGVDGTDTKDVPDGMHRITIPAEDYMAFAFHKSRTGDFWNLVCTDDNQSRYRIDLSKPRFESFDPVAVPTETIEWYIPMQSSPVRTYLDQLDHPMKQQIEDVRSLILNADDRITEHIKWNAPSFCFDGQDRITFNLHGKKGFRLVFHCGSKKTPYENGGPLMEDDSGLLDWVTGDRAILTIASASDLHDEKRRQISEAVSKWIEATQSI